MNLKNWHNAGMSASWGGALFGKKQNNNNNNAKGDKCHTQNNKSKQ